MELIKSIEKQAVEIKNQPPEEKIFAQLDEIRPELGLVMERTLFTPPKKPMITETELEDGKAVIDVDALFSQIYVDEAELTTNVRRLLQHQPQVSLNQVIQRYPITKGLAEVIGYLNLAAKDEKAMIDTELNEALEYRLNNDQRKRVLLPKVIFVR